MANDPNVHQVNVTFCQKFCQGLELAEGAFGQFKTCLKEQAPCNTHVFITCSQETPVIWPPAGSIYFILNMILPTGEGKKKEIQQNRSMKLCKCCQTIFSSVQSSTAHPVQGLIIYTDQLPLRKKGVAFKSSEGLQESLIHIVLYKCSFIIIIVTIISIIFNTAAKLPPMPQI